MKITLLCFSSLRNMLGIKCNFCHAFVVTIQRRIVGLHQDTVIGSIDVTDTWEPLEEGLLP